MELDGGCRNAFAGYIHKSQDVLNWNLAKFQKRRLLREAYAMPYSVSPCMFSFWACQSLSLELHGFHAFFMNMRYGKNSDYHGTHT